MSVQQQSKEFVENSRPAIEHIFLALSEYTNVLESAQKTVEDIERSKRMLSDLFMYRDQWSPDANHHYAQYLSTRIQVASATGGWIPKNTSFGVLKPRHFLGRLLSLSMMF